MRTRALRFIGVAVFTTVTAMVAFGGTAAAQTESSPADDLAVIGENLPAAVEALVAGLEGAAAVATDTQSTADTSAALGQALLDTANALVADTEQFGALGLGLMLIDLSVQNALSPYLGAIDGDVDPGDLFSEDDPQTLLDNVAPTLEYVVDHATTALAEGAKGNFVAPGLLDDVTGTPSLLGNTLAIGGQLIPEGGVTWHLLEGTSLQDVGAAGAITVIIVGAAVGGFVGEYLVDLEDAVGPGLDDGQEYTGPLVAILETL